MSHKRKYTIFLEENDPDGGVHQMLPGLKKEKKNDSASARKEVIISYCLRLSPRFFTLSSCPFKVLCTLLDPPHL